MYFKVHFEHTERVKVCVVSHLSIRLPIHYPTGPLPQSESSRRFIGTLNEVPTVRWLSYSLTSGGRAVVSRETACEKSQTNFIRWPIRRTATNHSKVITRKIRPSVITLKMKKTGMELERQKIEKRRKRASRG